MHRRADLYWTLSMVFLACAGQGAGDPSDSATFGGSSSATLTPDEGLPTTGAPYVPTSDPGSSGGGDEAAGTVGTGGADGSGAELTSASGGEDKGDPRCGDGVTQPPEQCDHGADNAKTAECTDECQNARCGDKYVQAGVEDCDDGDGYNDDAAYNGCTKACKLGPRCGDEHIDLPHEECELGQVPEGGLDCVACQYVARFVFITSGKFTGDLGGLKGADAKCAQAALSGSLSDADNYRAWLSEGGSSALERVLSGGKSDGVPYALLDGTKIATDAADLVGALSLMQGGIDIDEHKAEVTGTYAWTNTTGAGEVYLPLGADCEQWGSASKAAKGRVGVPAKSVDSPKWEFWWMNRHWTSYTQSQCDVAQHLLCFEQLPEG